MRVPAGCNRKSSVGLAFVFVTVLIVAGCSQKKIGLIQTREEKPLAQMGYTIQVGAFSKVENAARLTELLRGRGLNATYFAARANLYKVRVGNFLTKSSAWERAEALKSDGVIDTYHIVSPEEYSSAKKKIRGTQYVRDELLKTARSFVGVPYLWGGCSSDTGFDCSGLTMAVYQLNGYDLPRSSTEQFSAGISVERDQLLMGDLVFFMTSGSKASHVGIYAGDGRFIHAPGKGKKIRTDSLSEGYFDKRYLGARSYL
jgi:cell wall-associated NlpC family hydrolase